jgi:hypothetical protein|tara:strand:- start:7000 stop:7278 length:279 start_codon:yes stop_codon:yes gene_type:complete
MTNLDQVLAFIKNADETELAQIQNVYSIRKSEINFDVKNSFRVGDIVGINHKKIPSSVDFRITKINNKNIKVQGVDDLFSIYTVSPGLLVRR